MNAPDVRGGKNIRVSKEPRAPADANNPAVKKKSRRTNRLPTAFGRPAKGGQPVASSTSRLSLGRISRLAGARGPSLHRMLARQGVQRYPELDFFKTIHRALGRFDLALHQQRLQIRE